jgi:hypothetical protein
MLLINRSRLETNEEWDEWTVAPFFGSFNSKRMTSRGCVTLYTLTAGRPTQGGKITKDSRLLIMARDYSPTKKATIPQSLKL